MNYSRIKRIAEQKKISLKDLCRNIHISEPGFYKMLNKNEMKISTLEKICQVLNVPISIFFDEEFSMLIKENKVNKENEAESHVKDSSEHAHELLKRILDLQSENNQLRKELNEAKDKIINLLENK